MLSTLYNWFLNTFIRINPVVKTTIFLILMVAILWLLKEAFKKSSAKGGAKKSDWKISYFIISGVLLLYAVLLLVL